MKPCRQDPAKPLPARRRRRRAGLRAVACLAALIAGLGSTWTASLHAQEGPLPLIRDTEIEEILKEDAEPIFKAANLESGAIHIVLVGDKEMQAFAAPGVMAVYTGLILQTANPNELQGVMAHEIGHLAGGHSARSADMMKAGLTPMLLTMGMGVLAMLAGAGDAGAALMGSSSYFGQLGALGYSREQEGRADQAGAGFMEAAGLSAAGLVNFFDNFRYQEVFAQARRYAYFQSHPISSERIDMLRSRVEKMPHYNVVDSPQALAKHEIMKAKLQGFLNPTQALILYKEKDASFPARYARAIAYYQNKEPDYALRLIDGLLADQPDDPYLYELKGQVLFEFGRAKEAEAPQRKSVDLKPDAPLLRVNLAQTLTALNDAKKTQEAIDQLNRALRDEQDNSVAWRLLADAYDKQGQGGQARLATAEQYFYMGAAREAYTFAKRAQDLLPKNTPEWRRANDIAMVSEADARKQDRRGG